MIQARTGGKVIGYLNCEPERLVGGGESLLNLDGHAYMAPVRPKREHFVFKKTDTTAMRITELANRNIPRRAVEVNRWRGWGGADDERTFEFSYADLPGDLAFTLFVRELVEETDG